MDEEAGEPEAAPKKRANAEQVFARLREVETLIARRLSTSSIEHHLSTKWQITRRQVRDYIARVRAQWAAEATTEGRVERRDHLRQSVNDLFARAMARSEIVRDGAGNPIMDPATGRPMTREIPDLRTAVRASEVLGRLDGLFQDRVHHTGNVNVPLTSAPPLDFAKGKSRDELVHFAQTGMWPEDDARPPPAPPTR